MKKKIEFVGEALAVELVEQELAQVVGGVVVTTMIQVECPLIAGDDIPSDSVEVCGRRDSERVG